MARPNSDINKKQFENIMLSCGAFFTMEQVAECLYVGRTTLYRWIKKVYPGESYETLQKIFSSKRKFQINAYRFEAMKNGNARLIERSMEEEGLWQKRDSQKLDMTVTNEPKVILEDYDDGRGGYE